MPFDPDPEDRIIVEAQLGRPMKARWRVASRCHLGVPTVVENHPLTEDGRPFPTRLWLTCPILVKRVSQLEAGGALTEISDELEARPDLRERLAAAIDRYKARRDELAPIEDSGAPPGGGPDRVKCLHAHVAHEVAEHANPVGARGLETTGWPDCRVPCYSMGGPE